MKRSILLSALLSIAMTGCARFSTVQRDQSFGTNGEPSRIITTKAGAYTLWASESALANWKAAQTDKNQTASVGTVNQRSDVINSNVVAIVDKAVEAYLKSKGVLP